MHRVIQFNQEEWLKPYNDMNTELRTEAKNDFENNNNSVFWKDSGKSKKAQRYQVSNSR